MIMKKRLRELISMTVSHGFYIHTLEWLLDFLRMSDDDLEIDKEFVDLLDRLCEKFFKQLPDPEVWQKLIDMMLELCKVRRPRLRKKYPSPDQVQLDIDKKNDIEIKKTKLKV